MDAFSNFFANWKDSVVGSITPQRLDQLYFQTARDRSGFDLLPDFIASEGEKWAVTVASHFEAHSALAARLTPMEMAKYRMISDRHLAALSKADFDGGYLYASDERSLFLIFHRIPPSRVYAAMCRAQNASIDMIVAQADGQFQHKQLALISALTTLFTIDLNQIMRVYTRFERHNTRTEYQSYDFSDIGVGPADGYEPPTRNLQMGLPDADIQGAVEMF